MFFETYHALATALLVFCGIAVLAALASLASAVAGWRTPYRNRRILLSCGLFILAGLVIPAAKVLFTYVEFPTELTSENYAAIREQMDGKASVKSRILPGEIAPSFSLTTDEGTPFVLSKYKGSVVLITFFRTDCGPCNAEMPALQKIWEAYSKRENFNMIAISRGESMESIALFKAAHKVTFPLAADLDSSVYGLFASEGIPRTYLVARDGTLLFQSLGFMRSDNYVGDEEQIREEVANALGNSRQGFE